MRYKGAVSEGGARIRRVQWRLFLAAWLAFAFFHPGGGWNQNARFAMVRAVVEAGRLDVDTHLLYTGVARTPQGPLFRRSPAEDGGFQVGGRRYVLAWPAADPVPVRPAAPEESVAALDRVAASGDLAFARGHFHPNKAPGAALLAVPAYALLRAVERALGLDPDLWWVLTCNAWLTTALSVGLLSALTAVLVLRAGARLWPDHLRAATGAAVALAFASPFLPWATLLLEQNAAACALLAAFLLAEQRRFPGWAGLCAGMAVTISYLAAVPALCIVLYAAHQSPGWAGRRAWARLALGLAAPLGALALYHQVSFGSPLATAYAFQNPLFRDPDAWLGVFDAPRLSRLAAVLVSPFRGLFFAWPVLALCVPGLLWTARRRRSEALLFAAILTSGLLFCASFQGWHGGWIVGPRYLGPALPFVALSLIPAFARLPRTAAVLGGLSAAATLLLTAVDVQPPVGSSAIADWPGRPQWLRDPIHEFALPVFLTDAPRPLLEARRRAGLSNRALDEFVGPVSAHPVGVYESWIGGALPAGSPELRWNAFNAGELLLPGSRLSLALLLLAVAPLLWGALREAAPASRAP